MQGETVSASEFAEQSVERGPWVEQREVKHTSKRNVSREQTKEESVQKKCDDELIAFSSSNLKESSQEKKLRLLKELLNVEKKLEIARREQDEYFEKKHVDDAWEYRERLLDGSLRLYKTQLCPFGLDCRVQKNCHFAHGEHQLRCKFWYASKCNTEGCRRIHVQDRNERVSFPTPKQKEDKQLDGESFFIEATYPLPFGTGYRNVVFKAKIKAVSLEKVRDTYRFNPY
jgi:hypothetical protein